MCFDSYSTTSDTRRGVDFRDATIRDEHTHHTHVRTWTIFMLHAYVFSYTIISTFRLKLKVQTRVCCKHQTHTHDNWVIQCARAAQRLVAYNNSTWILYVEHSNIHMRAYAFGASITLYVYTHTKLICMYTYSNTVWCCGIVRFFRVCKNQCSYTCTFVRLQPCKEIPTWKSTTHTRTCRMHATTATAIVEYSYLSCAYETVIGYVDSLQLTARQTTI